MLLSSLEEQAKAAEETDLANHFAEARQICHEVSVTANSMMEAGQVREFDGDITQQGTLLHRGSVDCQEVSKKKTLSLFKSKEGNFVKAHMFFFEQCLIVTEHIQRTSPQKDDYKFLYRVGANNIQVR